MVINTNILTVIVGMLGIVLGTLLSPFLNHRLSQEYKRKEILFTKKLEYFENLTKTIEENLRMYKINYKLFEEKKKKAEEIMENLKKQRKRFSILSSPLYTDAKKISKTINLFVRGEKAIFFEFRKLNMVKKTEQEKAVLNEINKKLIKLETLGESAIFEMKKELKK